MTVVLGSMSKDRTRSVNALNALVRGNDLSIDARQKLTDARITEVSKCVPARKSSPCPSPVPSRADGQTRPGAG
jgi:hypothetical protein